MIYEFKVRMTWRLLNISLQNDLVSQRDIMQIFATFVASFSSGKIKNLNYNTENNNNVM